jgi:hypothetical protein
MPSNPLAHLSIEEVVRGVGGPVREDQVFEIRAGVVSAETIFISIDLRS